MEIWRKERYIIDKTTKRPIIIKDSEARKAGYWTICDIGKKRIRRAGKENQRRISSQTTRKKDYPNKRRNKLLT